MPAEKSSSPPPSKTSIDRFEAIDGLRALACLAVIFFHCFADGGRYPFPSISLGGLKLTLLPIVGRGFLGVEVFFVLSAFCLAYPIFLKNKNIIWRDYLIRRAQRILPPYWAAYLLFAVISLAIRALHLEPFYSQNFLQEDKKSAVLGTFFFTDAFNASFWTLCVEARWYFVLPILILWMRRISWLFVLIVSCILSAGYLYLDTRFHLSEIQSFSNPLKLLNIATKVLPLYLPIFAAGLWIAKFAAKPAAFVQSQKFIYFLRVLFVLSLVAVGFFVPVLSNIVVAGRIIAGGFFAAVLLLMSLYDPVVKKILSIPIIVSIGIASYSIYLTHLPFIIGCHMVTESLYWSPMIQYLWYQVLMPIMLVGLGMGFFLLVEEPFLKRQKALLARTAEAQAAKAGVP